MKKVTITQICTYSLIGLTSFIAVLSTNTQVLTQTAKSSNTPQKSFPSNLIWPTQGIVSQGFRKYQHEGIDIAAASGTPVVAAASGTVVKAGWNEWGLGNVVVVEHPDGSVTVYGHNSRLLVKQGQQVNQGQVIAEMGSTGNSTAPHLHFEVRKNHRFAVDPLTTLPSLIAGKIPQQQMTSPTTVASQANHEINQVSPAQTPQQVSSSQPIPVAVGSVMADTKCNGTTVIEGETANIFVKVCQENGQLFYIGQLKQDPSQPVRLPARSVGSSQYRADNGSFSYVVSSDKVEVWRNGQQVRSDTFSISKQFGK
ncbi:M23 family metallopeptidase [Brasilonema bromeliae]|uniref:M23 family peptidase n=1 Tax=Brasilonema bromeliae SPC951 TaxID=385972 RepID=A0ABX1PB16_9CYAN|nr:M23 family metallopeptidase [Brasilonema bromeliae]NMG21056.1 M23 family peptidase [Brasilonema bromeliae SPC951]